MLDKPSVGKPLTLGAASALVGAAAWGLLIIYAHIESGWLAWGIGALVGFAVVKGGGHGKAMAVCAALLTLLAIGSGKHIAFQTLVADETDQILEQYDEAAYLERTKDATDCVALGSTRPSRAIEAYIQDHRFDATVAEFPQYQAPLLEHFAAAPPAPRSNASSWSAAIRSATARSGAPATTAASASCPVAPSTNTSSPATAWRISRA